MFGNTKAPEEAKKSVSPTASTPSNGLNTLIKGSAMEGTLKCESDLRVDGTIKGKLTCKAKLIIGPTGVIEGEVSCQNAVIEGSFSGTLRVSELLNIRETAVIDGDIFTGKLIVQSGAKFNVACKMGSEGFSNNGANSKPSDSKNTQQNAAVAAGKA
jgi:cytoskeletal protein CcmA (bactofilin family)